MLAGSRGPDDPVAKACGVPACLAPVAGVPMAVRVVETLAACPSVGRIALALEDLALLDDLPALRPLIAAGRCRALAAGATPSLSVQGALDELPDALPLLVTTGDHPLLARDGRVLLRSGAQRRSRSRPHPVVGDPQGLSGRAARLSALSRRALFRRKSVRAARRARRGVALLAPGREERKRPWRLVLAFGWRPLLAYLLGRLTLDQAMARASRSSARACRGRPALR